MLKRSKSMGLRRAERQLVCGVCRGAIKQGERYTVRAAPGKGSYAVPLHRDCDSLLSSSLASRSRS